MDLIGHCLGQPWPWPWVKSLSGSTLTLTLGQGLDCAIVFVSWPFRSCVICLLPKGPLAEARWVRVRHSPHIEMKLRLQRFISKDLPGWSSHLAQPPAELKTLPSCSGQRKRFYGLMFDPTVRDMEWFLGPPPQGKLSRYLPVEQRGVGFAMHMKVPVCHFKWENGFLLHLPNNLKLWFWPTGSLKKQDFIKIWLTKDI